MHVVDERNGSQAEREHADEPERRSAKGERGTRAEKHSDPSGARHRALV